MTAESPISSAYRRATSEKLANVLQLLKQQPEPRQPEALTLPALQEMKTFIASSHSSSTSSSTTTDPPANLNESGEVSQNQLALEPIECPKRRVRLGPLTIDEYENKHRQTSTDLQLIERVFYGSISCNQLRAALWPYLFGLVPKRGRFEKIGEAKYLYIEHEDNTIRWRELHKRYHQYHAQWVAIQPDQEARFSIFRERKSLIERDVVRCDRLHPFYADSPQNLTTLTNLLMTYMMYDFDIGYMQGMSDLAAPILFLFKGDLVKAFWVFVEVMKLLRRNFEYSQKTIHFQLYCLHELIKHTDPLFALYLEEHESSNYFFAFRAILCQFKRELIKEDENDYRNVFFLWDTIWSANRRQILIDETKNEANNTQTYDQQSADGEQNGDANSTNKSVKQQSASTDNSYFQFDPNQEDSPRYKLTETELFVLALCLSMILRERDNIMANRLDGTDIHLHFIDPKLAKNLNGFIEYAINIYLFLKSDFDVTKLTSLKKQQKMRDINLGLSLGSDEDYDLLSDFIVIN